MEESMLIATVFVLGQPEHLLTRQEAWLPCVVQHDHQSVMMLCRP